MHGTGLWLGGFDPAPRRRHVVTLTSRSLDAHELLRTLSAPGDRRRHRRRRVRQADHPGVRRGGRAAATVRHLVAQDDHLLGRDVDGRGQGAAARPDRAARADRRHRIDRGVDGQPAHDEGHAAETARFTRSRPRRSSPRTAARCEPGSGEVGMVAAGGNVPLGYYKDPEKSARTFRVIDGVRYSFPGDLATVDADGSLILLGRGSQVINSAGEKVFPEEVEEAVKRVAASTTAWWSACRRALRPGGHRSGVAGRRRRRRRGDDHRGGEAPPGRLQGAEARRLRPQVPRAPTARPTTSRPGSSRSTPPAAWSFPRTATSRLDEPLVARSLGESGRSR